MFFRFHTPFCGLRNIAVAPIKLKMNCRAACNTSCIRVGGTLPVIRSLEENDEVKEYVPSTSK